MATIGENHLKWSESSMSKTYDLKSIQRKYSCSNHYHHHHRTTKPTIAIAIILKMTRILLVVFISMAWPLSSWAHSPPIPSSHTSSIPMTLSNAAFRQRLLFGSSNKQQQQFNPYNNDGLNYYRLSSQKNSNNQRIKNNRFDKLRHLLAKAEALSSSPSLPSLYSSPHGFNINPLKYFHYQHQQSPNKEPTCEELRFLWSIKQFVLLDELVNENYLRNKNKDTTPTINVNNDNNIPSETDIEDNTNVGVIDNGNDNEQEILRKMLANIPKEKQVYITKIEPSNSKELDDNGSEEVKLSTEMSPLTSENIDDKNSQNVNKNEAMEKTEAETVSPYGIVHNSPSSARRGFKSQLQPTAETIGFFGEFFEDFFPLPNRTNLVKSQRLNQQQLLDRYLNGYNLRNGKQGMKISSPSRLVTVGNEDSFSNGIGQKLSFKQNRLKQNAESKSMSSPSSSTSSSRIMLPGFWHEKPVKPSVNLIN